MARRINSVLKDVLNDIDKNNKKIEEIENKAKSFLDLLKKNLKNADIDADVFLGGSFAKDTMIDKKIYDIDIFVRFGKKHYLQNYSDLTQSVLKKFRDLKIRRIHGSRDYFKIKISKDILFEIIPVKRVKKPEKAENITDLSYSHVKYVKKNTSKKKCDEIKLAKSFCYANNCYGAESYINGFSGYGLELLIIHYKSFLKFIKSIIKVKDKKLVIDMEKHYKNKRRILMDINESKLHSPVILVDPTHKTRNVLAALSEETFREFQKACKKFIKKPSVKSFEKKEINFEEKRKKAKQRKHEFIQLEAKTNKQSGDVAGSKLKKFYNHLEEEIKEFFNVKEKGFKYNEKKTSNFFFVVKSNDEILIKGPLKDQKEHAKRFKKQHKKTFTRKGRLYTKKKINFTSESFIKRWRLKNLKKLKEMSIISFRIVG
ncbi:MAG: nucleotidyltransferase domain-containing protein [Candidatus Pacearchaeota archaeon]